MRYIDAVDAWGHVALASAVKDCGIRSAAKYIHSRPSREVEALMVQLAASASRTCEERPLEYPPLFRTGPNILPSLHNLSNPPSHTSTVGAWGRTPLEFGV